MYNSLLESLQKAPDLSLQQIVDKIRRNNFDKEVLLCMDSVENYQDFFDQCNSLTQAQQIRNVSVVLIFNKLSQLPSHRTSRYL